MKRVLSVFLCVVLLCTSFSSIAFADGEQVPTPPVETPGTDETSAVIVTNNRVISELLAQRKFYYPGGKGFAAEYGNNYIDRIKGNNAIIVGDNNVPNGPDRLILGRDGSAIMIQTKYYNSALGTINACFDDVSGLFRYVDAEGRPMQIEVPKDQYETAVELFREKIRNGKVPGVTNPDEAENIVRKGNLTFKQAENLAKAGTIESLKFDAATGAVVALETFGISTVLNYAIYRFNGEGRMDAAKSAALDGIKTGGKMFCVYVIASQFLKTEVGANLFKPTAEALAKKLGPDFSNAIVNAFGKSAVKAGEKTAVESVTKQAANILRTQVITDIVIVIVFTVPDAIDVFRGRISKNQFIKNFVTGAVTVALGSAGWIGGGAAGGAIGGPPGAIIGSIVGAILAGTGGGYLTNWVADKICRDDAEKMYDIVKNEFSTLCDEYMVSEEEAKEIAEKFGKELDEDMFKDMYQSKAPAEYIKGVMEPLFEEETAKRDTVELPTEEEMREALLCDMEGLVFIH